MATKSSTYGSTELHTVAIWALREDFEKAPPIPRHGAVIKGALGNRRWTFESWVGAGGSRTLVVGSSRSAPSRESCRARPGADGDGKDHLYGYLPFQPLSAPSAQPLARHCARRRAARTYMSATSDDPTEQPDARHGQKPFALAAASLVVLCLDQL